MAFEYADDKYLRTLFIFRAADVYVVLNGAGDQRDITERIRKDGIPHQG